MANFKCWDESNTDEDAAESYDTFDAETAAEKFAEDEWDNSAGECGNSVEVHVRLPDSSLEIYDVSIEFSPTFSASLRKPKP